MGLTGQNSGYSFVKDNLRAVPNLSHYGGTQLSERNARKLSAPN
jgi:hypothetical protein